MGLRQRLSLGQRIRRDRITDLRELKEVEQRQWGRRMREIASLGEPMAGLGFTGVVVPNNELITYPASVSSQAEVNLYTNASSGASTWMWIPPGTFRSPQSFRVWAGGTYSTSATTATMTWTTRIGTNAAAASSNASIGATGAMAPGSVVGGGIAAASATAFPWWYEAHLMVRSPGTTGTCIGMFEVEMACQSPAINTLTGIGATGSVTVTLDTTQGAFWDVSIIGSASPTTGAQLQQMTIVAWD